MTTYCAVWSDTSKVIFRHKRREQVRDSLPRGTTVVVHADSTLGRVDDGDEYEYALFTAGGQGILVTPDPQ
jgi:hypothetical protein